MITVRAYYEDFRRKVGSPSTKNLLTTSAYAAPDLSPSATTKSAAQTLFSLNASNHSSSSSDSKPPFTSSIVFQSSCALFIFSAMASRNDLKLIATFGLFSRVSGTSTSASPASPAFASLSKISPHTDLTSILLTQRDSRLHAAVAAGTP
jgi:hypothetical protein